MNVSRTPAYFVIVGESTDETGLICEEPQLPTGTWMKGQRLDFDINEPLEYMIDADYPGEPSPLCNELGVPLIRTDLLAVLTKCGVDNLQVFKAVVRDPTHGVEYRNFRAFNVVGLVRAADRRSELTGTSNSELIDVDFASLVIDGGQAKDLLLFRLAEAVSAIVVHEDVRSAVQFAQIKGVEFCGPGEWTG